MTSKEALEDLFDLLCEREHTNSEHSFWLKLYQIVSKDLKVLAVLKKNLVIEIDDEPVWDGTYAITLKEEDDDCLEYYTTIYVSKEEKDLLKEWLNEK